MTETETTADDSAENTAASATPAATTPDPRDATIQELKQQIGSSTEHKSKLNEEAKQSRLKKQLAQQEQGEFKALSESLAAERDTLLTQVGEMSSLVDKAKSWDDWQVSEQERISSAVESAPALVRMAVESASTLSQRQAIMREWQNETSGYKPPPSGGSHGKQTEVLDERTAEGRSKIREGWSKNVSKSSLARR